jgi:hypothetical protein
LRVRNLIRPALAAAAVGALTLAAASAALASGKPNATITSGGASYVAPPGPRSTAAHPIIRGWKAKIIHGVAYAPSYAPIQVQRAIWAGDKIRTKPYIAVHYASLAQLWPGYDCSGSVSYVLFGAGLLTSSPDVSGDFESYGLPGRGRWITVWGSGAHAFVEIAGIVFDTAHYASVTPSGSGPRWQPPSVVSAQLGDGNGYSTRHPDGF